MPKTPSPPIGTGDVKSTRETRGGFEVIKRDWYERPTRR